jgi:hypothetical protein
MSDLKIRTSPALSVLDVDVATRNTSISGAEPKKQQ